MPPRFRESSGDHRPVLLSQPFARVGTSRIAPRATSLPRRNAAVGVRPWYSLEIRRSVFVAADASINAMSTAQAKEIAKLKQETEGDIVVPGSFQLLHTLMEHDLVDELRLKIFPVVLGAGERLFGETSDKKPMRLVETQILDDGVAYLTYERLQDA